MEDIKAGEYVRTKNGKIDKVKNDDYYMKQYIECEKGLYLRENITKHSFNLMDLLETKDIVALEYYVEKYAKLIIRKFEVFKCYALIKFNNIHCDFLYNLDEKKWTEEEYDIQIKQILTHEQFETNCYKVEGDKESK